MSLTLEKHERKKSPEKSRRRVKFSNENTSDLQSSARKKVNKLTTKQKLVKQSFELRKKFEELSSEWQEKLFETVDINVLRESAKYLLPQHYFEIVEERNADNLCGYPICNKDRQEIQGQFRISNRARKIYDISELKCYCSTACFTSSKFFMTQLSEEPVYLRNLENWKAINVIPLGINLREIIKKEKSTINPFIKEDDRKSTYVKDMFANLPPAPPGLIIKEKNDKEIEAPSAPIFTNDANAHDVIEGFRIGFQGLSISDSDIKPTTLILSKEVQVVKDKTPKTDEEDYEMAMSLANSMFRNGKFHYQDNEDHKIVPDNMISNSNSIKTIDSMKNNKELVNQPTSIECKGSRDSVDDSPKSLQKSNKTQQPPSPEKQARKKKRVKLQMSLFGTIWTALDRMATPNTRRYFKSIDGQFTEGNDAITWRQPITNENALMRIQIFSEKIIECYHILRKHLAITAGIERELINLMSTFTFDTTTVVFNDLENNVLCMVFLYALSMDITELRENIFPEKSSSKKDGEYQFKTILESMNLTIEELDAFVRVLRIGPV